MLNDQNLVQILGIEALPDERKLQLLEKVSTLVERRLVLRLLKSLSPAARAEFENILDSENEEAISLFMEKNAPDLMDWIVEETSKIKQDLGALTV
ncbi:MAG: hypothetical protein A3H72_03780 [Candidatus Doudnabacteria bacterium RIFCSPLOWO2_02_FULL_48_8]|uniref:Uncharacterized protein n=1 Tax=Candidatus Doudnabacteria bacterium RIFCSPHIGHO2_01_FULL_46_24 TaxID=1817825 RepID=A0A1F5NUT0_9BACT|nr:MAG: hypothetical protein A2720_02425 [Candidatus Doudnabacteria bacterium RIFCSPHIGHO2_01_FULL_46_24]OGE94205.1 MAG: hypothetical protein A3E98_00060 [Candidatus Doudnabacteria bacterium RIFCSPHIGHO2_12_FULL_48_11]OGE95333.1 MAG: hypothetical protein A3H72_03780 [Candidatus Doudnabacteria bacterium RIFCSPLOWO2_02_FULL_48_8]